MNNCRGKKASPSKGLIRPDLNHIAVAEAYLNSDVQAMSVLTETDFFLGRPEFISDIRKISNIPLLRKDFIIDEYQIYEAYMLGADAVLLIAAILDDTTLKEFMSIAESLGLDCLTEVHDIEEMKRVNNLGAKIVGINNRNLKTFEEDLHTTERLTAGLENRSEKAVVSESGIKNNTDLRYLETLGIDAVLIGESFMRRQDIAGAVSSMRGL
ncbi:MAG: indole-3-glycerol phosphate synthase TrpC [Monoglobus pectinilyticus]|uniref:indole-3-glycerol phosphate synthase TrpC n=1 Tax=Monoglobus pectinilyticus TaxID=1981510 RepID=UPI0039A1E401